MNKSTRYSPEVRERTEEMVTSIDDHKVRFGVEPICAVLPIAPSTYYANKMQHRDPDRGSARAKRDDGLKPEIQRVWADNFRVYGVREVWRQLKREAFEVARCTVTRLMRDLGLRGVQYLSIRYAERLQEAGIEPSVGSVGDSYDNALAETINRLYKTEVIRQQGPWRDIEDVEFATLGARAALFYTEFARMLPKKLKIFTGSKK